METTTSARALRLALPKGRMQAPVEVLLADAGLALKASDRSYRPGLSLAGFETKLLKPQNIVEMLALGTRDLGFAGADWVRELGADPVEVLDTGLDPVEIVAAAPRALLVAGELPRRALVIASEEASPQGTSKTEFAYEEKDGFQLPVSTKRAMPMGDQVTKFSLTPNPKLTDADFADAPAVPAAPADKKKEG
jgi:hypothetical protein